MHQGTLKALFEENLANAKAHAEYERKQRTMETKVKQPRAYADDRIEAIVKQAKSEGLKTYTFVPHSNPSGPIRQVYITDGTNIATVSKCDIISICVSTVHKGCIECGTGFRVLHSDERKITLKDVHEAMTMVAPRWAGGSGRKAVRKYKSWDEYTSVNNWTTYTEL